MWKIKYNSLDAVIKVFHVDTVFNLDDLFVPALGAVMWVFDVTAGKGKHHL